MKTGLVSALAIMALAGLVATSYAGERTTGVKRTGTTAEKKSSAARTQQARTKDANTTQSQTTQKQRVAAQGKQDAQQTFETRQGRQAQRIEHGVKKGYLTAEETERLQNQQEAIAEMHARFNGDGALTREEARQLGQSLNNASILIWTEKHDTTGNQMPVYRLGKSVFLNDATASKLQDPALTRDQARAFTRDFSRMMEVKRTLSAGELSAEQRAALEKEYGDLLNKYFVQRAPSTTT